MVKYHGIRLNKVFSAISDPTRRAILRRLQGGSCTISQLAEPFQMSLAAISKHLRALEDGGLIRREKLGRSWHCHLQPAALAEAKQWLGYFKLA
ncbi:helix-turn-helix transcriptional regulator [bacterium]|nr:helix-turn-helix transcriptional regulator [bacterium]